VRAIQDHCGRARSVVDVCVVNTAPLRASALRKYRAQAAQPVEVDVENLTRMGLDVLATDLLRMRRAGTSQKIRHDPGVIGAVALELAQQGRRRKRRVQSL
jgi:hypothetical protein